MPNPINDELEGTVFYNEDTDCLEIHIDTESFSDNSNNLSFLLNGNTSNGITVATQILGTGNTIISIPVTYLHSIAKGISHDEIVKYLTDIVFERVFWLAPPPVTSSLIPSDFPLSRNRRGAAQHGCGVLSTPACQFYDPGTE
jgi:hypothetical protein